MKTYLTLYKNEKRAVELEIDDSDGQDFILGSSNSSVLDANNNVIVSEQAVYTYSNKAYTIIGTATTGTIGLYKIKWKIVKGSYTYYHITNLEVIDL